MPAPNSWLVGLCLRYTFDAGLGIRTVNLYVDDSEGAAGLLKVLYADLVPPPDED